MYLHHQYDGVECDQSHDAVLEGRRHHKLPHAILETQLVLGHVARQRSSVNDKIDTSSLSEASKVTVTPLACLQEPSGVCAFVLTSFFSKL